VAVAARQVRRLVLAPLDPDSFCVWAWRTNRDPKKGIGPVTTEDIWFEWSRGYPELTRGDVRRLFVKIAAQVRRNQRLGLDPWAVVVKHVSGRRARGSDAHP
jgi:hypothetical protein